MNYIKLVLTLEPMMTLCDDEGAVIEEVDLLLDFKGEMTSSTTDVLVSTLADLNWEYSGILLHEEIEGLNDVQLEQIKLLEERLNCPLIFKKALQEKSLESAFEERLERVTWSLDYFDYIPGKKEYGVETMLTVGNGYIGLRGTLPEMTISDNHYPATYIAGQYNEAISEVEGKLITNEDFVNSANLQFLTIQFEDGDVLDISKESIQSLKRHLDLKTGLFHSVLVIKDNHRELEIETKRLVNMANKHHYSLEYKVTPLNFSEPVTLIAKSDGAVYNYNTERYRQLNRDHLVIEEMVANGMETRLVTVTKKSGIRVIQQSELVTKVSGNIQNKLSESEIVQAFSFFAKQGESAIFEKNVTVVSRLLEDQKAEGIEDEPLIKPQKFEKNYHESSEMWQSLWHKVDIQIQGDMMSQKLLRLHGYHLLVSGSPEGNESLDVSITARGLHGEAYRGHIFWDEIFILPFYQLHFPEMTRQLLMYRYNRLGQAKVNALAEGHKGAMFPWQSGLDGTEQSQEIHLNPLNGEWDEDYSRLQRHVSLAIAYNVISYANNTNDQAFMIKYGNEMLLEIAAFWHSKATWSPDQERYIITGVMGPDEFHEAYPNSQTGGLTNNAYTNIMVAWLFKDIVSLMSQLPDKEGTDLLNKVGLKQTNIDEMAKISRQLVIPIDNEGVIAQFEGYFDLKEIDWDDYKEKYGNIYRMDRILSAEGKRADDYQVAKQADLLMTFFNLPLVEVTAILENLGYTLPTDYLKKNYDYYIKRTSHGSTLSRIVHAQLAEQVGYRETSWELYQQALKSDYEDIQGGTIAEGIHTGVMAATVMVTLQTYGGLDTRQPLVTFKPDLPKKWEKMTFNFTRLNVDYQVSLTQDQFEISASEPSDIVILDQHYHVPKNEKVIIDYRNEG